MPKIPFRKYVLGAVLVASPMTACSGSTDIPHSGDCPTTEQNAVDRVAGEISTGLGVKINPAHCDSDDPGFTTSIEVRSARQAVAETARLSACALLDGKSKETIFSCASEAVHVYVVVYPNSDVAGTGSVEIRSRWDLQGSPMRSSTRTARLPATALTSGGGVDQFAHRRPEGSRPRGVARCRGTDAGAFGNLGVGRCQDCGRAH